MALTPAAGARDLVTRGHRVLVERSAGAGSAFPYEVYAAASATLASVDEVWDGSELLLKVKEPIASEYRFLREGLVLFTYLHLAADEALTRALVERDTTAVGYETVETDDRRLPLLAPMNEVAGRLATRRARGRSKKSSVAGASYSVAFRAYRRGVWSSSAAASSATTRP